MVEYHRTGPVATLRMSGCRIQSKPAPWLQDYDFRLLATGVLTGFRCAGDSSSQNALGSFCPHPL
jgi:hypothetical protein